MRGKVMRFNAKRGFGFIRLDDSNEDIFFYYNAIEMDGFKTVKVGQVVDVEVEKSDKGLRAKKVVVVK